MEWFTKLRRKLRVERERNVIYFYASAFLKFLYKRYAMKIFAEKNQERKGLTRDPNKIQVTERESILREIAIMKRLNHPNLVHLEEVCNFLLTSLLVVDIKYSGDRGVESAVWFVCDNGLHGGRAYHD